MNQSGSANTPSSNQALMAENIVKRFGHVLANDSVSLSLSYGKIHALLGENGAGKSTFVSILYGLYPPDSGSIYLDDQGVDIRNPNDALELGIGLVQQHFSLIPSLTVLDNIILGREICSGIRLNRKKADQSLNELSGRYGMNLPLHERVAALPVGMRQQVEIAKILYRNARIMLFDEPTAALVTHETERFLETLNVLKKEGIAVLLITHRMPEVLKAADEVTVLRKGKTVLQKPLRRTNAEELSRAIIGEEIGEESLPSFGIGEPFFRMDSVSASFTEHRMELKDISLDLHEGELLGIAGVAGNGQEELLDVLMGLERTNSGSITLTGENITNLSTEERRRKGIALIPQDRVEEGLLPAHSLLENYMLNRHAFTKKRHGFVHKRHLESVVQDRFQQFQIQASSPRIPVNRLSGGHQQRVLISRELMAEPKFVLAHNPTRGLDIRASRFVHETLHQICREGAGVILFSSELTELFLLCQRIAVMHQGRIIAIRSTDKWDAEGLGKAMTGGTA